MALAAMLARLVTLPVAMRCAVASGDLKYTLSCVLVRSQRLILLNAAFVKTSDAYVMNLHYVSGREHSQIIIRPADIISEVLARLRRELGYLCWVDILMPSGELLSNVTAATFAPLLLWNFNQPAPVGVSAKSRRLV